MMHIFRKLSIYYVMILQFPKGRPLIALFAKTDLKRQNRWMYKATILQSCIDHPTTEKSFVTSLSRFFKKENCQPKYFFHNKSFCNSYSFTTIFADRVSIFGLQQDWQKLIMFILGPPRRKAVSIFMGGFICYYSNLYFTSWPRKSSDNQQGFTKSNNP